MDRAVFQIGRKPERGVRRGKMEVTSEMLETVYQTTPRHNPEDLNLNTTTCYSNSVGSFHI
jgi:hypothetical protein